MTNREYMIHQLGDDNYFDDCGTSYEAMVYYTINCPYRGEDERANCSGDVMPRRDVCFECKQKWLDSEVDT